MTLAAAATHYVYGIVDAAAVLPAPPGLQGLGGAPVGTVSRGELAAVISELPEAAALGTRDDLLAHERVVSGLLAAGIAVLPMRFGAVLAGEQAVGDELLAGHHDALAAALEAVRGRVQFTVRARYERDRVLREVIRANPRLAALRESAVGFGERIQLGEQVVAALGELRDVDAPKLMERLGRVAEAVHVREPADADEVVNAAFLVTETNQDSFVEDAERLAERVCDRIRICLVGPQACYDFVPEGS